MLTDAYSSHRQDGVSPSPVFYERGFCRIKRGRDEKWIRKNG